MRAFLYAALAVSVLSAQPPAPPEPAPTSGDPARSVLVFLPQQFFSNDEFDPVLRQLSSAGISVKVAAAETTAAVSTKRVLVNPDISLAGARAADFAGIVLIGGSGASLYWDDTLLQSRCREFAEANKVVAAIGIAPVTLARAGVLKGRRATVYRDRDAFGYLRQNGARLSSRELVVDRNIVTAANQGQARAFGRAVAAAVLRGR
jgi:protease I